MFGFLLLYTSRCVVCNMSISAPGILTYVLEVVVVWFQVIEELTSLLLCIISFFPVFAWFILKIFI